MDSYKKGAEARDALIEGVFIGRDAVALTIGPKGKDAILEEIGVPHSVVTNDGASILERITVNDHYQNMGLNLLKEAVSRSNKQSGDGSTTACILTAAILEEGQKYFESGEDLKQSLFDCLPLILKSLDDQTEALDPKDIAKVAAVSAQDESVGALLGEIFSQIGKDGVVDWDNSYSTETSYEIKEGVELKNTGFMQPFMATHNVRGAVDNPFEGDRAIINNPRILITQEKIASLDNLRPYMEALLKEGKREMVVFYDEIEPVVLAAVAENYLKGVFKVTLLKAPTLWKDWIYEDFALMTGAVIVREETGANWKTPSLTYLGTCDRLVAFRNHTNVIGGKDLRDHIKRLEEASKTYPDYAARAGWLNSKSAVVKLGGRSEVEISYKRLKLEDASWSAKNALNHGVVTGGGYPLKNASKSLPDTVGGKILKEALHAPLNQIEVNMRAKLPSENKLKEQGILDAAVIPKNAISAAISVAGTVLNCDIIIPLPRNA